MAPVAAAFALALVTAAGVALGRRRQAPSPRRPEPSPDLPTKMPAEVIEPPEPLAVDSCPNVRMPVLPGDTVVWPWGMTANLQAWALAALRYPLGTIIRDVVDGRPVIARLECHDRYGADPSRPPSWHKGTSVYAPAIRINGRMTALEEPPAEWPGV